MLSMTGYGSARVDTGNGVIVIEARAVNHRFLDVRARLWGGLGDYAVVVEEVAKATLERGRVELTGRMEGALGGPLSLDRERAASALRDLRALRDEIAPGEPLPLALLSAVPDLFAGGHRGSDEVLRAAVERTARQACDALQAMRRAEGNALAADLGARTARIVALVDEVTTHIELLVDRLRARLRARIATLLEGTGASLDPGRLEQEVALLADRADVSEELTRLRSHCAQIDELLAPGGQAVGRRLEFLLQEVGREINTLGSKVSELAVTRLVVELKTELERMREQAQNVL
ncbi:MAG TPA: YicC/YloC family endoribonuclease [Polyangiales bacterium]|nr:YicC/YloC family endoribonuclease [Polyangiales bacterium]